MSQGFWPLPGRYINPLQGNRNSLIWLSKFNVSNFKGDIHHPKKKTHTITKNLASEWQKLGVSGAQTGRIRGVSGAYQGQNWPYQGQNWPYQAEKLFFFCFFSHGG